jgi:acyl carrier protein
LIKPKRYHDYLIFNLKGDNISMGILEDLEKILLTEIAVDLDKKSLMPDEDLLEQGIIDSMGIMKLVTFMEQTFCIQVLDEDIIPENFQNLKVMAKFVEQKRLNK